MSTMPTDPVPCPRWTVVLPVKGGRGAKSRLAHDDRSELARAFALDAVEAVLASPVVARVVVVTGHDPTARAHADLGATVVTDPGGGLVAALLAGAGAGAPDAACALLLADLPTLRPDDVTTTLRACGRLLAGGAPQVTVPDTDGDGTVLLAAARPGLLQPRFGPGSARAHAACAEVLDDAPARLRRDVDDHAHLVAAVALGVGRRTAAVLAGGAA